MGRFKTRASSKLPGPGDRIATSHLVKISGSQYILADTLQDPEAWVTMEAMARCQGDEGRYESAIDWMEKALEAFYQLHSNSKVDAFLLSHIARWKQDLGDHARALKTAKR